MAEPIQLYICFDEENRNALARLERQLKLLERAGKIRLWHRGKIVPGDVSSQQVVTHLDQAQVIIVLVSASIFGEYYESPEMQHAFRLYKEQKVRLIPIIVGPCAWKEDPSLGRLEPLPKEGKPAGLEDRVWSGIAMAINQMATQIQAEQVEMEPTLPPKSPKPRARAQKSNGSKPQPFSDVAVAVQAPAIARPPLSKSLPAPAQPALPESVLPAIEEPEPVSTQAIATAPAYRQDYDQTQNDLHQIMFAILIWEPSQSTHDLIADERRTIYRALLDKRHQCMLGSSLSLPEGQSLQDRQITQAQASDMTILLVEPEISPISEWREFYYTYEDEFLNKILCYYPETARATSESWKLDETLYAIDKLHYYQEAEITNCQVRTKVLKFVEARCIITYRDRRKGRSRR